MARVLGPSLDQLDERGDKYAAEVRRSIKKVVSEVAPTVRSIDDLIFMRSKWNDIASAKLQKHLYDAWTAAAGDTYQQLVKVSERMDQGPREQLLASIFIPKVVSRLAELFLTSALNKIFSIGELVWDTARKQMVIGLQNGESIPEIRQRIMQVTNITERRAEAVARTQVIGAMNAGSFAEMKATGLTARKEWIATEDPRTRVSHRHVDGAWADIDEKFIVGGYAMSYPHDPTGPDQEVINCRCTLGWDIPDEEFVEDEDDQLAASGVEAFHLPGRHDQKDHGRKGLRGLSAGKSLKITHGLVHKKHDNGSIIAVNKNGDKHVLWEDGKYHLRKKDAGGLWQTEKTAIKSKAYKEINDFAPDWHEPAHDGDEKVREPDVVEAPAVAPTPDVVPTTGPEAAPQAATSVGEPLKITHGLIHKKHPPGTTIAVNKDGTKQVVWDGAKYNLQSKQDDGSWKTDETALKSKAYVAVNAYDSEWHEPIGTGGESEAPSAPTPQPNVTPAPVPEPPAPTPTPTPEVAPAPMPEPEPVAAPEPKPEPEPTPSQKTEQVPAKIDGTSATPAIASMASAYENGYSVVKEFNAGASGAKVELLRLSDGSLAVRKGDTAVNHLAVRREYLSGLMYNAVGIDDLSTAQLDENTTLTTFIPGKSSAETFTDSVPFGKSKEERKKLFNAEEQRQLNLPGAKEMGMLDWLINNIDRHTLNWNVPDNDKIRGLDHGNAQFSAKKYLDDKGVERDLGTGAFTAHWLGVKTTQWNEIKSMKPKFTKAELAAIRTKIEGFKDQFSGAGEDEWYNAVLSRLSTVEAQVKK